MSADLYTIEGSRVFESTHLALKNERHAALVVLRHLQAIEDRKLFVGRGYPSLFELCIKEFGYSNGAAHRRIQAMRLLKATPAISEKIATGEVSITTAAAIQSFLKIEEKSAGAYSESEKLELIEVCAGKPSREVEKELATRNPSAVHREIVRAIGDDHMRVSFNITDELWRKIEQLKALRSHAGPMSNESLLEWLVELGLDRVDPIRKADRAQAKAQVKLRAKTQANAKAKTEAGIEKLSSEGASKKSTASLPAPNESARRESKRQTRYIRAVDNHALAPSRKDGCAHVSSETGRRCGSHYFLQKDHVISHSEGGSNASSNLQWLCGAHNRWKYSRGSTVRCESLEYVA
ncbi:MAG: HNH endonuclease signature motif containing protein [Bdellovibrionota bacterium]